MQPKMGGLEKRKSQAEILLESLHLSVGTEVEFIKRKILTTSSVPVGTSVRGVLATDVKLGEPIRFHGNTAIISNITDAATNEGKTYIKTSSSVYELVQNTSLEKETKITWQDFEREQAVFAGKFGRGMKSGFPLEDDPYALVFTNNGFKAGDQVMFGAEGERDKEAILRTDKKGSITVVDKDGNRNGVLAILRSKGGYIKKIM